jgi:hypothetical protein
MVTFTEHIILTCRRCTGRLNAVLLGRLKAALFVESRKCRGEGMLAKWWQNSAC